jgi:precorrin-2 dehydrogenase/sirohydrochlorin ferrochelatase
MDEILLELKSVKIIKKVYEKRDLSGFTIVYACTNDENLNRRIAEDARELGILVNVCDRKDISDFISPAIYKINNINVAVSSNGEDVKKSIYIRDKIKELFENGDI